MFEKLLKKLGYTKSKKVVKQKKQIQKLKEKGKWSPATKKRAHDKKVSKKWRKKNHHTIVVKRHKEGLANGTLKVHFSDCPECNPNSNLKWEQYVIKVRVAKQDRMLQKTFQQSRKKTVIFHKRKETPEVGKKFIIDGETTVDIPKDFGVHDLPSGDSQYGKY